MRFATNASSPGTSSNVRALTIAWWAVPSVSWRARSTYESDQRCFETGQTGPATKSFRRTTDCAAAGGGLRAPAQLLSALVGRPARGRDAGVLRLVFLEMVEQQSRTPIRRRGGERGEGRIGGAVKGPAAVVSAQIRHPSQHQHCCADKRRCDTEVGGRCPVRANQRVDLNVADHGRRSSGGD